MMYLFSEYYIFIFLVRQFQCCKLGKYPLPDNIYFDKIIFY